MTWQLWQIAFQNIGSSIVRPETCLFLSAALWDFSGIPSDWSWIWSYHGTTVGCGLEAWNKQKSESQGWSVGDELLGIILANFSWGFQTKPMGFSWGYTITVYYYTIFLGDSNKPMGWIHGIQVMFVVLDPLKILAGFLSFLLSHQPAILGVLNSQDAVNMLPVSGDMVEVDDALQAKKLGEDAFSAGAEGKKYIFFWGGYQATTILRWWHFQACCHQPYLWLIGGLKHFLMFHTLGIMIPTD